LFLFVSVFGIYQSSADHDTGNNSNGTNVVVTKP